MDIKDELNRFISESSEQEKEVIQIFLNSLKAKRENTKLTHIASLLQLQTTVIDEKTLEMEMPNSPLLDNSIGIVHGGLTATLLDTALGTLASHVPGNKKGAVTVELKVDYLTPGIGKKFICRAAVIHNGRQLVRMEGKVRNEKENLIASATGTFFKLPE
ncbi:PaaI family thioesterase [Fictibacillus phosphorivorans]|uniref:PaaI family thioesterase n=1 Tax=Fictibacillus phosphorivorans TaxID=1221500 RepID=UPI00204215B7|nr:PaaI family thioesterase [Fictibacillus phosphorivorans]MCM3774974.1 PaaI family thioesterase [Fictibacillus phosphorivorans]